MPQGERTEIRTKGGAGSFFAKAFCIFRTFSGHGGIAEEINPMTVYFSFPTSLLKQNGNGKKKKDALKGTSFLSWWSLPDSNR